MLDMDMRMNPSYCLYADGRLGFNVNQEEVWLYLTDHAKPFKTDEAGYKEFNESEYFIGVCLSLCEGIAEDMLLCSTTGLDILRDDWSMHFDRAWQYLHIHFRFEQIEGPAQRGRDWVLNDSDVRLIATVLYIKRYASQFSYTYNFAEEHENPKRSYEFFLPVDDEFKGSCEELINNEDRGRLTWRRYQSPWDFTGNAVTAEQIDKLVDKYDLAEPMLIANSQDIEPVMASFSFRIRKEEPTIRSIYVCAKNGDYQAVWISASEIDDDLYQVWPKQELELDEK